MQGCQYFWPWLYMNWKLFNKTFATRGNTKYEKKQFQPDFKNNLLPVNHPDAYKYVSCELFLYCLCVCLYAFHISCFLLTRLRAAAYWQMQCFSLTKKMAKQQQLTSLNWQSALRQRCMSESNSIPNVNGRSNILPVGKPTATQQSSHTQTAHRLELAVSFYSPTAYNQRHRTLRTITIQSIMNSSSKCRPTQWNL